MTAADTASHSQSCNNLCIVLVRLLLDPAYQNGHQDLLPSVLFFFYILHCNIGKVFCLHTDVSDWSKSIAHHGFGDTNTVRFTFGQIVTLDIFKFILFY